MAVLYKSLILSHTTLSTELGLLSKDGPVAMEAKKLRSISWERTELGGLSLALSGAWILN